MEKETIQLLAVLLQTLVIIGLFFQVHIMHKSLEVSKVVNDSYHERLKKQSTLEYAGEKWLSARVQLERAYGVDALSKDVAQQIYEDNELRTQVLNLLGTLEHISAGVNSKVYDEDILYRMAGASVIDNFNRFKNYIKLRRQNEGNDELYIELEELSVNFMNRQKKERSKAGDMIYS